ncbi:MAG: hypothetical protein WCI72_05255 [archaeon]
MVQNFVYNLDSAIEVTRNLGVSGLPSMDWRTRVFGYRFYQDFAKKVDWASDVFYITPVQGSVNLNFKDSSFKGFPSQDDSVFNPNYNLTPLGELTIRTVDFLGETRHWTMKALLGEAEVDKVACNLAKEFAEKYGKVGVVSTDVDKTSNGLFSVYFPTQLTGCLEETIVRHADSGESFENSLDEVLGRIRANCS